MTPLRTPTLHPGEPEDIPQTGNAPVLMRFDDFAKVCPRWVELTAKLEKDEEAKEAFGWVREMYAYSIAAALAGVKHATPAPPHSPLMVRAGSHTVPTMGVVRLVARRLKVAR